MRIPEIWLAPSLLAAVMFAFGCTDSPGPGSPRVEGPGQDGQDASVVDPAGPDGGAVAPNLRAPFDLGVLSQLWQLCGSWDSFLRIELADEPPVCAGSPDGRRLVLDASFALVEPQLFELDASSCDAHLYDGDTALAGAAGEFEIVEVESDRVRVRWDIELTDGSRTLGDTWVDRCPEAAGPKCI